MTEYVAALCERRHFQEKPGGHRPPLQKNNMIALNGSINSEAAENSLNVLQAQLSDLSPSMGLIAADIREMEAEQFASAGASGGTPWAALASSTVKRKRGGGGILVESGALLNSLTDPESPDHVEAIDKLSLEIGTDLPYARFQQTGAGWGFGEGTLPPAPRHGHGVPMRPLLVLTADHENKWIGFVMQQITASYEL
jgi:phage gpG-like protein